MRHDLTLPLAVLALTFGSFAGLTWASTFIRTHGPVVREAFHSLVTAQFVAGWFAGYLLLALVLFGMAMDRRGAR